MKVIVPQWGSVIAVHVVHGVNGIRLENRNQVRGESQQWKGHDKKIVGPPP
jgi:hypothetical protein